MTCTSVRLTPLSQSSSGGSGGSGGSSTPNLVIDFNDASALGVEAFGGATALPSVQTDPDSVDQSMLQLQKPSGAEVWAGVTLAEEAAGSDLTADGTAPVTMKVNAPVAGVLTLKLETSDGTSVEMRRTL